MLVLIVGVGVQRGASVGDGSGDGVPDGAAATPVWVVAGLVLLDVGCWISSPPNFDCFYFVCLFCDGVTVTVEDNDGHGLPDEAFAHTPAGDLGPVP